MASSSANYLELWKGSARKHDGYVTWGIRRTTRREGGSLCMVSARLPCTTTSNRTHSSAGAGTDTHDRVLRLITVVISTRAKPELKLRW
jgi:hypothetical protein